MQTISFCHFFWITEYRLQVVTGSDRSRGQSGHGSPIDVAPLLRQRKNNDYFVNFPDKFLT